MGAHENHNFAKMGEKRRTAMKHPSESGEVWRYQSCWCDGLRLEPYQAKIHILNDAMLHCWQDSNGSRGCRLLSDFAFIQVDENSGEMCQ